VPGWSVALDDEPPDAAFLVVVTTERVSVVGLVDAAGAWRWWWPAPADRTFSSPRPTADGVLWSSQDRARADAEQLAHVAVLTGEQLGGPGLVEFLVVLGKGRPDRQLAAQVVGRLLDDVEQRGHGADVQLDLDALHAGGSGWITAVRCHCCNAKT